jgi:hypothetical protein
VEGTSTVHRSLSIARRLAAAATVLVALGVFSGTAHADVLNLTPHTKGSGRITTLAGKVSSVVCESAVGATTNESTTTCAVTHGTLFECGTIPEKCGQIDLQADPADGWSFVGWQTSPATRDCTARLKVCHVESNAKGPLNIDAVALFRENISATLSTQTKPVTSATTASFAYSLTGPAGSTFQCQLDGVAKPCGTIAANAASSSFDQLPDGAHSFEVTAVTPNNNPSDIRSFNWTVDTAAPTASLDPTSGPGQGGLQTIDSETFKLVSSEASGATFTCSLDQPSHPDQPRLRPAQLPRPHRRPGGERQRRRSRA